MQTQDVAAAPPLVGGGRRHQLHCTAPSAAPTSFSPSPLPNTLAAMEGLLLPLASLLHCLPARRGCGDGRPMLMRAPRACIVPPVRAARGCLPEPVLREPGVARKMLRRLMACRCMQRTGRWRSPADGSSCSPMQQASPSQKRIPTPCDRLHIIRAALAMALRLALHCCPASLQGSSRALSGCRPAAMATRGAASAAQASAAAAASTAPPAVGSAPPPPPLAQQPRCGILVVCIHLLQPCTSWV